MDLLELMKLDMTNFTIEQLRPHLQQQSVEYERTKFKEFLETQSRKFMPIPTNPQRIVRRKNMNCKLQVISMQKQ